MLATGGLGNIYQTTTNPVFSTGDGIAMAYRAKAVIDNLEFVPFHPTSLFHPGEKPSFLITEAMRGAGAILKNKHSEAFMADDFVFLDARNIGKNELINNFPTIYAKCLSIGIDITSQMIPVVPAAHYSCGGIKTDKNGLTSIQNLYASGEVASTGLHGANRLASNSLLESAVFSHRAALHAVESFKTAGYPDSVPDWDAEGMVMNEEMILITQSEKEVQSIMSNYVGIVRSNLRLQRALDRLEIIYNETEELYYNSIIDSQQILELRNLINVAYLVIKFAQERKESIGLHFNIDY